MRGFLLSLDALVAVTLIVAVSAMLTGMSFTYSSPELAYQRYYFAGKDIVNIFEEGRVGMLDGIINLSQYNLTNEDANRSILDVIGSFWADGDIEAARNLTKDILDELLNSSGLEYEILIDDEPIYSSNISHIPEHLARLSTIVSGYEKTKPVNGYISKVYITKVGKRNSKFVYFGGYVGDGNITKTFELPNDINVTSIYMEMNVGSDFDLFLNENYTGHYTKSSGNFTADKWTVANQTYNPEYLSYISGGLNKLDINFTGNRSYVGGGYIRIDYMTSELTERSYIYNGSIKTERYTFPGIKGIINLYSSFYVPGEISNISAHIHYKTDYTIFLTIGNKTIFEYNGTGEEREVELTNENFTLLNYEFLSNRTVPIRFGTKGIQHETVTGRGYGDVILSTDVSGSMDDCGEFSIPYTCHYNCLKSIFPWNVQPVSCIVNNPNECTDDVCGSGCIWTYNHYLDCNRTKLDLAKHADKTFIDIVLNTSGNRVGLNSYSTNIRSTTGLTTDKQLLYNDIDSYTADGSTCICCGIIEAINMLNTQSNETRKKAIVIMSDGQANVRCNNANEDLNNDGNVDALDDTIQAGCDAYNLHNMTVYTIGFGEDADEDTLQRTAACGNGKYYYSNSSELAKTFSQVAHDWVNASYEVQTVIIENKYMNSTLYPDSYIEYTYSPNIPSLEYGEITLKFESPRLRETTGEEMITDEGNGTKDGWFVIPGGGDGITTRVIDAKITSYSSNYWTDRLWVNSSQTNNYMKVFWLGDYGNDYSVLGDPYIIHIPSNYLTPGGNNSIKIGTGFEPTNGTGGSPDDRVIYTLGIKGVHLREYSDVLPKLKGCSVRIYYDLDGDNTPDGWKDISIGPDSNDIFDPQNDSIDNSLMKLLDALNFIDNINEGSFGDGSAGNPYDGINQSNPIDLEISENFEFKADYVSQITSLWGPALLEIRTGSKT